MERKLLPIEPWIAGPCRHLFLAVSSGLKARMHDRPEFQDIESTFDDDAGTIYLDNEHYTEAASERLAQRIAVHPANSAPPMANRPIQT